MPFAPGPLPSAAQALLRDGADRRGGVGSATRWMRRWRIWAATENGAASAEGPARLRTALACSLPLALLACVAPPQPSAPRADRDPLPEQGTEPAQEEDLDLHSCGEGVAAIGPDREAYPTVQAAVGALAQSSRADLRPDWQPRLGGGLGGGHL
jgi:hypothetical protein